MSWLGNLFGGSFEETIDDAVYFEQRDEETDIDLANDALFNATDEDDCTPEGFYAPPPQRVWWRL